MQRLFILSVMVILLYLAWVASARLPSQSVPWGPVDLAAPLGLFTKTKLTALRDDAPRCTAALERADVEVSPLPDRTAATCPLSNQMQLDQGLYPYSAAVRGNCGLIAAVAVWEREVVAAAAARHLKTTISGIDHAGIFSCRNVRGSTTRPSQHASATAIDISGFRLRDGRRITVAQDWGKDSAEGRFLKDVRDGSCRVFRGVLGPDYNRLHHDHFHFDLGRYSICR